MRSVFVLVLLLAGQCFAAIDTYEFDNEVDRARYRDMVQELRCPKCQNQNIADSNAPIATDLRRELYRLLQEGKSDKEIIDFMVARYGDFVLYRPPMNTTTAILWITPVALVGAGILVVLTMILRQRRKLRASSDQSTALSSEEQARLDALLAEDND